jgi:hypothetical protein
MRSTKFLTAVASFAALSLASPFQPTEAEHEVRMFKRGEPLTPEDLTLAEMHSVNTTESMYFDTNLEITKKL